jgi:hypothetical protein
VYLQDSEQLAQQLTAAAAVAKTLGVPANAIITTTIGWTKPIIVM